MKKYIAEVVGTFILVFIGVGSVVAGGLGGALPLGQVGIGLCFGLAVTAAAYAIGPVSGAHLNPAVTVGAFLAGRMSVADVIPYIIAQLVGATLASVVLLLAVSGKAGGYDVATLGFGQNGWDPVKGFSMTSAFLIEVVATFVFVTVILGVTHPKHTTILAGLVIGLTLAILHMAFIPVSGNSLNPARAFGPALFAGAGALGQLWLYIVAPLIGGALAGIVSRTGLLSAD
ncbi:MIP family channel protein [Prosthecomicrobium hirschii]|uniref:Porin n=1 Tax=Prosthecodimorpha hirschii TaxID=665126 RepID=A0A0N8GEU1_9HYPH|nr:MIP family channel protein [Prosthecomicrobium hirschii]KPL52465.1 porin [Prosthecomicrobium hirschii]MCW1843105.1 MIP family channel protein [Prosthecomicrobium hirschii]TPQ49546.1 MIP family channel protein [Prosthecomicrobium hirschii]